MIRLNQPQPRYSIGLHSTVGQLVETDTTCVQQKNLMYDMERVLVIICAHNEQRNLSALLSRLKGYHVLLVDDGSTDMTREIALKYNVSILHHGIRQGKSRSLQDAIVYALKRGYRAVVEIGADSIPEIGSIEILIQRLNDNLVGAVSARQIPVGVKNIAYHIDELLWSVLAHGKAIQERMYGYCHLGAVMYAFRPEHITTIAGSINDDEELGNQLRKKGLLTTFAWNAVVYFDASCSVGHIFERRRRMIFGHMRSAKSIAPSMEPRIAALSLLKSIIERPSRIIWAIPAIVIEFCARLSSWRDLRSPDKLKYYSVWVTKQEKNDVLAALSYTLH